MKNILNSKHRAEILGRLRGLDAERPALWGKLTAPRMLVHLCDQMLMTLGEHQCAPIPGPGRYPVLRELFLYILPWPKGKIQGRPEVFLMAPTEWDRDLATLNGLVERFVNEGSRDKWPDHPHFGRMSRRAWGVFCHRHFDHHIRQFGG